MWEIFGFKENPYSCRALQASENDVDLLIGRKKEAVNFYTNLETAKEGIVIISGKPGLGKTSFLNVQQYLLESETAICGPRLIACRHLTTINPEEHPREIALRALHNLYKSVMTYCMRVDEEPTDDMKNLGNWITDSYPPGFQLSLNDGGFGRQFVLPYLRYATYEVISDIMQWLVREAIIYFDRPGIMMTFDNIENLEEAHLNKLLITFRDTLFSIPNVWWVLIGQSGLSSFIQSLDQRVSQRISGNSFELDPISKDDFHAAIEQRIAKFSNNYNKAPLHKEVHEYLYDAASGQIRFVFKYATSICTKWLSEKRNELYDRRLKSWELDSLVSKCLVEGQIEKDESFKILKDIVNQEIVHLRISSKEVEILRLIGNLGSVRPKDHGHFSIKTMQQFSSQYLTKLHNQSLLTREQEGKAVIYSLGGLAMIAHKFNLF